MSTSLIRKDLRAQFRALEEKQAPVPHAGLLLQSGLLEFNGSETPKSDHIQRVCEAFDKEFYSRAYRRWCSHTEDTSRFRSFKLALESRLFVGLSGGGMLETGCAIGHSHGAPYIPGSSIKGVVAAHAKERLGTAGNGGKDIAAELFGAPPEEESPGGMCGLIAFYDAWWVPGSAKDGKSRSAPIEKAVSPNLPLVPEIVTSHHLDYYGSNGATPATDFDSPVPNAQIGIQGSFRFTLAGPAEWLDLAQKITVSALSERGVGARTRSGYGYFSEEREPDPPVPTSSWIDVEIERQRKIPGGARRPRDEILRSRGFAKAWRTLDDAEVKKQAFLAIKAHWHRNGWWDSLPGGRSMRQAKAIYDEYETKT